MVHQMNHLPHVHWKQANVGACLDFQFSCRLVPLHALDYMDGSVSRTQMRHAIKSSLFLTVNTTGSCSEGRLASGVAASHRSLDSMYDIRKDW